MNAVRFQVGVRNTMGGAMYWNVCNDEACICASHALALGADRKELEVLLGAGNLR